MKDYMKHILTTVALALALVGCGVSQPKPIAYKVKNVPVTLDDKHYEYPPIPEPSLSRSELKKLKPTEMIAWQTSYIIELTGHITLLEHTITSIKEASKKEADIIKKGNEHEFNK